MDLQKGPLGILGWFALKVTGRNPTGFGDSVVPVAEVGDHYLATSELQEVNVVMPTLLQTTNGASLTVPNGKVWRVIAVSMAGALNAADAALLSQQNIGFQSPNGSPKSCLVVSTTPYAFTNQRGAAATMRPPVLLPSGWKIVYALNTSAAITVTSNIQCDAMIQEFDL